MIKSRAMLLAGVSALAMLACVAEAKAEKFSLPEGSRASPCWSAANIRLTSLARAAAAFGPARWPRSGRRADQARAGDAIAAHFRLSAKTAAIAARGTNVAHEPITAVVVATAHRIETRCSIMPTSFDCE